MSYYRTLEVLTLCDAIDKVPSIRQTLEQENSESNLKRTISYPLDSKKCKIPKIESNLKPQHDLLELDSIFTDKPKATLVKHFNDDAIRNSMLTSSEAALTIQKNGILYGLNVPIPKVPIYQQIQPHQQVQIPKVQSSLQQPQGIQSTTLQQQTKSLQYKKNLQNQHFQNSSSRLSSLSSPIPSKSSISTPIATRAFNYNYSNQDITNLRFPELSQKLSSTISSTPISSPPPHLPYTATSTNSSRNSSRPTTPGGRRIPHNAGFTTADDGLEEICEHCQRIFRGPKSSTHKQQHIKRIHPEDYVRKKGGIKSHQTSFIINL
ncbi:hypothetical protein BN7_4044 [Wickerhamomyces ciferrii]|uniref:Uncharacterized protein n=1 Tax=Wickerhamomyces ciferrii (strain ATCC 14091 / BCRC 22168 / CBS 111 / JCM 3599 / NBRC 0793 / NRRL Y-1031 F-60-10) TaxID=1206466 RepID=K0KH03_WICCF|nr:uncharacterized protein BN7_4044 [Wickerhamomyces ciferrii]CCH44480.1 hypothetical protein BN7_4044 [Wickerhamomyces ciferrii]